MNEKIFRISHASENFLGIKTKFWARVGDPEVFSLLEEMKSKGWRLLSLNYWNAFFLFEKGDQK